MHTGVQKEIQRKEQPVCAQLEEDVNELFLINNSVISTLVCHFITDSVSDFGGALFGGGHRPGCRARGSLGLEHPFLPHWWAWGIKELK